MAGDRVSSSSVIRKGEPFTAEETRRLIEQFNREGYCSLGAVLEPDEVEALKDGMVRKQNDPSLAGDEEGDHVRGKSQMRMFESDYAHRDLLVREPFASLAEAILGDDCHVMAQNALLTEPVNGGKPPGPGAWHTDDLVYFPLPAGVERHDPRITMPCFVFQIFTPLTDVDSLERGPTQIVPGSHYSGRQAPHEESPTFEGRGPVSMLARAGDAYMFTSQVWHRGAPNASDRTRYMTGVTYSKRFVSQRFYPFIDYRMPDHVFEGADARLQRMLGRHEKGPYG